MRFYEYVASKMVDKVTLDKLTMDTFESAKRSARAGKEGRELCSDVFHTCLRANLISYLADYTVHQVILLFGYYAYVRQQQRKRQSLGKDDEDSADGIHGGSLALSFVKNSTLLAISRAIGWLFSSIGAGVGATLTPGWGCLAGANLGDGFAMTVSDEIIRPNPPQLPMA